MQTLSTSVSSMVTAAAGTSQATGITSLSWLLVALPLLGAAVLLFGGRRTDRSGRCWPPGCPGPASSWAP